MNKNNSRKFSDVQLERLTKTVLRSVILTDDETEEIVDAPHLWRKLQSRIADEKARREQKFWIFSGWNWRTAALAFGAIAVFFAVGAGVLIFNRAQAEIAETSKENKIPTENGKTDVSVF